MIKLTLCVNAAPMTDRFASRLAPYVTAYDRRRAKRPDYNVYALPPYLGRAQEVCQDAPHIGARTALERV